MAKRTTACLRSSERTQIGYQSTTTHLLPDGSQGFPSCSIPTALCPTICTFFGRARMHRRSSRFIRALKSRTAFEFRRHEFTVGVSILRIANDPLEGVGNFPIIVVSAVGARVADLKFSHCKNTLAVTWFLRAGRWTASRREEQGRDLAPAWGGGRSPGLRRGLGRR
jgi:hypothetical protein